MIVSRMMLSPGLLQNVEYQGEGTRPVCDSYDSDGDGVSNLIERAFGGDSLGKD